MRLAILVATLLVAVLTTGPASAHAMRSVFVEVEEIEPGHASLHLRTSVPDPSIDVVVGTGCAIVLGEASTGLDRAGTVECEGAMAGHSIGVRGLGPVLGEAVVFVRYADGSTFSHLLTQGAGASSWTMPAHASVMSVARQYMQLGVLHILGGYDHLVFLLLLVLTLRSARAVLLAETCFTLSHSFSFTATALGWVHIAAAPAEACIALSLVLVALDVGRVPDGADDAARSRQQRGVAGLAFLFGLVHGLGFAGGLREIGLPEREVATALASFAAGVEVGQVAFLSAVLACVHFARRWAVWPKVEVLGAYVGGAVSSFWVIERVLACF
jgi:hypothetical protein